MNTPVSRIQCIAGPGSLGGTTQAKASDIIIERICRTYTQEDAKREGILYWPGPLPTPESRLQPDPLVLFQPGAETEAALHQSLVPLTIQEVISRRYTEVQKPSMQIPLGLIDKPETQQQETLLADLHGASGVLTGGPMLILGAMNSGKGTALQTLLLWLTTRYLPSQLKCIVIDPNHDLEIFRDLPHLQDRQGNSLWSDGASDEEITHLADLCTGLLQQRRTAYAPQHWNDETLAHLWSSKADVPLILLIISQYHRFADRINTLQTLKKLVISTAEARAMGAYVVLTSAEIGMRHLSADIVQKISTRISLFINEQQRADFFGRIYPMDPIPGRGILLTQDRHTYQIQFALPTYGATETDRYRRLQQIIQQLRTSI